MSKYISMAFFALILLFTANAAYSAPVADIVVKEFDFGFAPQNTKLSYPFWIKSTGDELLKIINVIPGCGCTQMPLEKNELVPGDSAKLEVIFSTKRYKDQVVKTPRIETNEGTNAKTVMIKTFVVTNPSETFPIVISPYKLDLSQFGDKERNEIEFTIKNVSNNDLNLNMIYLPSDYIEINLPDKITAGVEAKATVRIKNDKLADSFEKSMTFELNDEKHSRFTIPVIRNFHEQASK